MAAKHRKMPHSYNPARQRTMLLPYAGAVIVRCYHRTMPAGIARYVCRAMRTSLHDARILRCSGPSHDARGVVRCLKPSCDSTIVRWSGASYDDTRPPSLVDALCRNLANGRTPLPSICAAHWPIDQHRTSLGSSAPKPDMLYYAHNSFSHDLL